MKELTQAHTARKTLNKEGGFALTELLFVIGIVALILGAVAAIAITTSAGQTAQNEMRIIDSSANKIRSIYSSRPDFNGLTTKASIDIQAWPSNMTSSPNIYNAWGGAVTVDEGTGTFAGQVAQRLFEIKTDNVSENSCVDLATASSSALGVKVDGTTVYERGGANDPVDAAAATASCAEGVSITFIFGKNA